ncbi:hypothetical protein AKJ52_02100 [candidate division MSBL1 archaeon SCGC-AAA382C18]|uniref:Adenosylcobinamide-GDP ribazoletransferase n=1 Tax=candidate division MSBL1 archaeon SCGC-AAA382C18 TaxID=1698281 RepID=A0A133VJC3_9EURY|nr:hypothetical protein AKJ52_02100 [candidate division MSBL1 archaeon SCGC-AAA382C18]
MLKGIREVLSFLTIIPTGENGLSNAPDYMFFFPLVGLLVGFLSGVGGFIFFQFFPNLVSGCLTFGLILIITGLHHTDGLIDFGDGLMKMGSHSEKIEVMRDTRIGVGGIMLSFIVTLISIFAISNLGGQIIKALIVCEGSAKFSMVVGAGLGESASKGLNTPFLETMKGAGGSGQLIIALAICLLPSLWMFGLAGLYIILGIIGSTVILTLLAERNFGGVTGDVFGSMNEISRMLALVILSSALGG